MIRNLIVIDQEFPGVSNLAVRTSITTIALLPTPALDTDIDLGINLNNLDPNDSIAAGVLYTRSGTTYGSKDVTQIQALLDVPLVRQIHISEDLDSNSQVKFSYWWDNVQETTFIRISTDGGGITINATRTLQYHNFIEQI